MSETKDLTAKVGTNRTDEIGQLATRFDEMLEALKTSQDQQHRLIQDAAHELRTPLTSIKANIDLMAHAGDLPEAERTALLNSVRGELRELNAVFTEVIELATDNRDSPSHLPVDLAAVGEAAVAAAKRRTDSPIRLDAQSCVAIGDFEQLERAIANLLSNAIKYGPANSPIEVSVSDGTVLVTDRGPGIAKAEDELIFERFSRTADARSKPGSGLGLSIVKKIVEDHGGSVIVRHPSDGGLTVGFSVPVTDG